MPHPLRKTVSFQHFSQSEKRAQNVRSISALFPLNRRSVSLQSAQYLGGKHCADKTEIAQCFYSI